MNPAPPENPIGAFEQPEAYDEIVRTNAVDAIAQLPAQLREAVAGLIDTQLGTVYRNWSIRQITHHVADSHLHSIIRFKWALTEDCPKIKAYEEGDWVQLADCAHGDVAPALALLDGLHSKWVQLLQSMTPDQYARKFIHPQTEESVSLWMALNYYAWHGRHHTGQILWLRGQNGW